MKYENSVYMVKGKMVPLEIYKVQVALFGGPSVLIYNEDRSQMHEEYNPNNVKVLQEFIGKNVVKCYCCGYLDDNGKINLVDKVNDEKYWF